MQLLSADSATYSQRSKEFLRKKLFVKTVAFICALVLLIPAMSSYAEDVPEFNIKDLYIQTKSSPAPTVFEATILAEENAPAFRLGTVVGNYCNLTIPAINFEIRESGRIAVFVSDGKRNRVLKFDNYDVRNGEKTDIKITLDYDKGIANLYINGKLTSQLKVSFPKPALDLPLAVGGDLRESNSLYLNPTVHLYKLKLSDGNGTICEYDFQQGFSDLSGNGYDLVKTEGKPSMKLKSAFKYIVNKPFDDIPKYIEASIKVQYASYGGIITGNYGMAGLGMKLSIDKKGIPSFTAKLDDGTEIVAEFNNVVVPKNVDFRIGVIIDGENYSCFIDNELAQTVKAGVIPEDAVLESNFHIGNDNEGNTLNTFTGEIKRVAFYSDSAKKNRIADFVIPKEPKNVNDMTGKYRLSYVSDSWEKEPTDIKDYAYSVAVVGDIQTVVSLYPEQLHTINDWILKNKESKKIEYCFYTGDLMDFDTDREWKLSTDEVFRLNGEIPYSLVRGNHDSAKQFLKYSSFELNYTQKVTLGGNEFLIVALDYGPDDETINWAAKQIEANPESRVIITTHAYLFRDGTTLDENDVCPPSKSLGYNDGDDLWEKLVRKYGNIELVICGHDPTDDVVVTTQTGDFGNTVTQILVDPQYIDNEYAKCMVFMMYFSEDGRYCECEYYSTTTDFYRTATKSLKFTVGDGAVHYSYFLDANGDKKIDVKDASCISKNGATDEQKISGDNEPDSDEGAYLLKHFLCNNQYKISNT